MAELSKQEFLDKWAARFADNTIQDIDEADFRDFRQDIADSFAAGGSPNRQPGLWKAFRFLTKTEITANNGNGEAFEDLVYGSCCIHTRVYVEFYQPDPAVATRRNVVLVAVYDPTAAPAHRVYVDGSFRPGDLVPVRFVPEDDPAAKYGFVRPYDPAIANWRVSELTIYTEDGHTYFASAKRAGQLSQPLSSTDTTDWKREPTPMPTRGLQPRQYLSANQAQGLLDTSRVVPGQPYAIQLDEDRLLLLDGGLDSDGFAHLGELLLTDAQGATSSQAVLANVAAGTYQPVGGGGAATPVDADLTSNPASTTHAASVKAVNDAFTALINGAPSALDTLRELAEQLARDEQGAAAILATQQQHTQQLTALAARGGRNRALWTSATDYLRNDWVIYQGLTYYANADFTSGAAFDSSKWTQFGAGLTAAQVAALNPLTYPVMVYTQGGLVGYPTLKAALSSPAHSAVVLNVPSVRLDSNAWLHCPLFSYGGEIVIADGATLSLLTGLAELHNVTLTFDSAAAGTGKAKVAGSGGTPTAAVLAEDAVQLVNARLEVPLALGGSGLGVSLRGRSQVDLVTGVAGQVYLYELSSCDQPDPGITVVRRRPTDVASGGGGASYTAGPGIDLSAGNVISATNGQTLFQGSTGRFYDATSPVSIPANAFYFLPMQDRPLDVLNKWDAGSNSYEITRPGSYLVITKVLPAQGTQGFQGRDFYCGPSVGVPADNEDGNWEQVSSTSRRGIKISTAKHYNVGDKIGLAHYQENGGYAVLCSMSIILLKAD